MHFRMQRLDAAVHHLGKAGELGHVADLEPGGGKRLGGAAGRNQFHAVAAERARELDQSGLVGHRDQGAGDAAQAVGHGTCREPEVSFGTDPVSRPFAGAGAMRASARAVTQVARPCNGQVRGVIRQTDPCLGRRAHSCGAANSQRQFRLFADAAARVGIAHLDQRPGLPRASRAWPWMTICTVRRGPSVPAR